MHTIAVPVHVLPRGRADALLAYLTACEGVLAAGLDQDLTLRVLTEDHVEEEGVRRFLEDVVAPLIV